MTRIIDYFPQPKEKQIKLCKSAGSENIKQLEPIRGTGSKVSVLNSPWGSLKQLT